MRETHTWYLRQNKFYLKCFIAVAWTFLNLESCQNLFANLKVITNLQKVSCIDDWLIALHVICTHTKNLNCFFLNIQMLWWSRPELLWSKVQMHSYIKAHPHVAARVSKILNCLATVVFSSYWLHYSVLPVNGNICQIAHKVCVLLI